MRTISTELLEKINKSQQTIYENADPKLKVLLSQGFSKELFRVYTVHDKTNIAEIDVTAKRSQADEDLNKLYVIYIENDVAHVKSKDLPYDELIPWTYEFELGSATNVAIDFDGEWQRSLTDSKYYIVAQEYPWLFKVNSGILTAQYWQNSTFQLATDVVKLRVLRGWKSTIKPTDDDGIVVVYTKSDGHVYYRNYCMQSDGNKSWEEEREITELPTDTVDIALFRTNDYRIGIIAQDSSGNILYVVTERTWSGMGIPAEYVTAAPVTVGGLTVDLIPIEYIDGFANDETISIAPAELDNVLGYTLTDNKFAEIYNEPMTLTDEFDEEYEDWGKLIVFRTKHRLFNLHAGDFEVVGEYTSYFADEIEEIVEEVGFDGKLYRIKFLGTNNFNNAGENPTLKYNSGVTTNGIDMPYDAFEKGFSPQNLVPTAIPLPEVEVIYNE